MTLHAEIILTLLSGLNRGWLLLVILHVDAFLSMLALLISCWLPIADACWDVLLEHVVSAGIEVLLLMLASTSCCHCGFFMTMLARLNRVILQMLTTSFWYWGVLLEHVGFLPRYVEWFFLCMLALVNTVELLLLMVTTSYWYFRILNCIWARWIGVRCRCRPASLDLVWRVYSKHCTAKWRSSDKSELSHLGYNDKTAFVQFEIYVLHKFVFVGSDVPRVHNILC